jgi:hypothetical protein
VELEALSAAIEAKRLGWVTLRVVGERDGRLDTADIDELIARAANQQDRVEDLRRHAVASALTPAAAVR